MNNEDDATFGEEGSPTDLNIDQTYLLKITDQEDDNFVELNKQSRITSDIMTTFEYARAVGIRAQMIQQTGLYNKELKGSDAIQIAVQEIRDRKSPLILVRDYGSFRETFHVNEMILPKSAEEDIFN